MKIRSTKTYPCRDPILGLQWAPGAVIDLEDGVARKFIKEAGHSFEEVREEKPPKADKREVK